MPDPLPVLDWRTTARVSAQPRRCVLCGRPALLIAPDGRPCHKVCAEARLRDQQQQPGRPALGAA